MAENKTDFIAPETLFLDKDDKVVGAKDPRKLTKLVQAGGRLPRETALRYGLIQSESQAAAPAAVAEPAPVAKTVEQPAPRKTLVESTANTPKPSPVAASAETAGAENVPKGGSTAAPMVTGGPKATAPAAPTVQPAVQTPKVSIKPAAPETGGGKGDDKPKALDSEAAQATKKAKAPTA